MFNKKYLTAVARPACVLLLVTLLVMFIQTPPDISHFIIFLIELLAPLIPISIWQAFAYITCWAFVLRKGKPQNYVWFNYIVWIFIANFSPVMEILGIN